MPSTAFLHTGDARPDQTLFAVEPEGEADQIGANQHGVAFPMAVVTINRPMFLDFAADCGTTAKADTCAGLRPTMFMRPREPDGSITPRGQEKFESAPWSHFGNPTKGDGQELRQTFVFKTLMPASGRTVA